MDSAICGSAMTRRMVSSTSPAGYGACPRRHCKRFEDCTWACSFGRRPERPPFYFLSLVTLALCAFGAAHSGEPLAHRALALRTKAPQAQGGRASTEKKVA